MDDVSDSSSIWQRLTRVFHNKHADAVERAIRDASEEGELDKEEGSMLLSVLTLDELQVQDIMTPRTDIACSSDEDSIRQVAELIVSSGHSRIPIFSGNRDNIIGIVHAKDLLCHLPDAAARDAPIATLMRDPFFVPETKNVLDLLQEFRARKLHLAVVLDEYGGTAGLVSIEDVLEQIVGDIEDEHDAPREQQINAQTDGSYLIAGRASLDHLTEDLPVTIISEEVDTLGGYLTHLAGRVPKTGEEFSIDGRIFRIVSSDAKRIHRVRMLAKDSTGKSPLSRPDSPEGEAAPQDQQASPPQTETKDAAGLPSRIASGTATVEKNADRMPDVPTWDQPRDSAAIADQARRAEEPSGSAQRQDSPPGA